MVNLTIDGLKVCVPEGTTIMQAAASVGIEIPRLCYLKRYQRNQCLQSMRCRSTRSQPCCYFLYHSC